jgi:DNA-binding Lrp family transcriptional regulator
MVIKLDLKDRKILYLLSQNAQIKTSELAALVGLNKNSISYRIKRLIEKDVIAKFQPVLNYKVLGLYTHDIFIKLRATAKDEEEIKKYFKEHPSVLWAISLFGKWDIFVQIVAPDLDAFERVLKDIIVFIGDRLDDYEIRVMVDRLKITRYIPDVEKVKYFFKRPEIDYSKRLKLDELDKKILTYLNEVNGLAQHAEVARAVKTSMETVRNRTRALFRDGVILNYLPLIDYDIFGLLRYFVTIKMRNINPTKEKEIIDYALNKDCINLLFKPTGMLELYFFATVKQPKDLEKLIKEFKLNFFDNILDINYAIRAEELALNFFPKVMQTI